MIVIDLLNFHVGKQAFFYVQALGNCEVRLIPDASVFKDKF